ncbi:hypothetical protein EON79_02690 [bacterium]|nr:MAG: hypothetical protein EON79_02690 [bacterium]
MSFLDTPRDALRRIVAQYGPTIATEATRVEELLWKECPYAHQEIGLLANAVRAGVPEELLGRTSLVQGDLGSRLIQRLQTDWSYPPDAARWTVEAWAQALGVPVGYGGPSAPGGVSPVSRFYATLPNGMRYGPVPFAELEQWVREGRVTAETMVEEEGTGRQMPARSLEGLSFAVYPRDGYGTVETIPNHLVKSIICTLCCSNILGIVAIYHATRVDFFLRERNYAMAKEHSRKANAWANWSIGIMGVLGFIWLLVVLVA